MQAAETSTHLESASASQRVVHVTAGVLHQSEIAGGKHFALKCQRHTGARTVSTPRPPHNVEQPQPCGSVAKAKHLQVSALSPPHPINRASFPLLNGGKLRWTQGACSSLPLALQPVTCMILPLQRSRRKHPTVGCMCGLRRKSKAPARAWSECRRQHKARTLSTHLYHASASRHRAATSLLDQSDVCGGSAAKHHPAGAWSRRQALCTQVPKAHQSTHREFAAATAQRGAATALRLCCEGKAPASALSPSQPRTVQ